MTSLAADVEERPFRAAFRSKRFNAALKRRSSTMLQGSILISKAKEKPVRIRGQELDRLCEVEQQHFRIFHTLDAQCFFLTDRRAVALDEFLTVQFYRSSGDL
jgi:hypothetical protein